jgi:hypothetical protein
MAERLFGRFDGCVVIIWAGLYARRLPAAAPHA